MRIRVLGSSPHDTARRQYVSSYLINESVAIDAGCLGFCRTPQEQAEIRHVFLTHSHIDHTASLAVFLENAYQPPHPCPTVYGSAETLDSLHKFIFNDVVWPDFIVLSARDAPFLRLQSLAPEQPVEVENLEVTPVAVSHVVPTFAYVVSDGDASVIFAADSGPTERIWHYARKTPNLKGVFLEASFPNSLRGLAEVSMHLTPQMFGAEVAKMNADVRVIAVHIKTRYRALVVHELEALGLPSLEIGECETDYFV